MLTDARVRAARRRQTRRYVSELACVDSQTTVHISHCFFASHRAFCLKAARFIEMVYPVTEPLTYLVFLVLLLVRLNSGSISWVRTSPAHPPLPVQLNLLSPVDDFRAPALAARAGRAAVHLELHHRRRGANLGTDKPQTGHCSSGHLRHMCLGCVRTRSRPCISIPTASHPPPTRARALPTAPCARLHKQAHPFL